MKSFELLHLISAALQDLDTVKRWPWQQGTDSENGLLNFVNAALLNLCMHRPDASQKVKNLLLRQGSIQFLPKDSLSLIEIICNMAEGEEGQPISLMPQDVVITMSNYSRPETIVQLYAYDRLINSQVFYVFPKATDESCVRINYSLKPALVTEPEQDLPVPDIYAPALLHLTLATILGGDHDQSSLQKAQYHLSQYNNILGLKQQVDVQFPKTRSLS